MDKNKTNILVEKVYYVLVNIDGDYIKLERDNQISFVNKTYQATKGTKEEMIRFYANLVKLINENKDDYAEIQFGGLLRITEKVENDDFIDLSEIDTVLKEFEPKSGLNTSGQKVVFKGLNIVQKIKKVSDDLIFNLELDDTDYYDDNDILINTKTDDYDIFFGDKIENCKEFNSSILYDMKEEELELELELGEDCIESDLKTNINSKTDSVKGKEIRFEIEGD